MIYKNLNIHVQCTMYIYIGPYITGATLQVICSKINQISSIGDTFFKNS